MRILTLFSFIIFAAALMSGCTTPEAEPEPESEAVESAETTEDAPEQPAMPQGWMHNVYCSAEHSHPKPDYPPGSILQIDYAADQPFRIGAKAEFSDLNELDKAVRVHLASGRYALLRLKLYADKDIFPIDHQEIGEFLRQHAEYYGSDFVIEMPDRSSIWYCSRCFSK